MTDQRTWQALKNALAKIPKSAVMRFSALDKDPPARELAIAECWLAAAGEINSAYAEQRSGIVNYRLDGDDVGKLNRYAAHRHYEAAERVWRRDPANQAAEATYRAALAASPVGKSPDLPPEVAVALSARPARPTCQPLTGEIPEHWPPMLVSIDGGHQLPSWTRWVATYLHVVRERRGSQEPHAAE